MSPSDIESVRALVLATQQDHDRAVARVLKILDRAAESWRADQRRHDLLRIASHRAEALEAARRERLTTAELETGGAP